MTHNDQQKQSSEKGGIHPAVAAVAGALVGVGVAGAVALKDEKNRKKVKKVLSHVKDQAMGYMEDMQKQAQDKKGEIEEKLADGKEEVKEVVSTAKDTKVAHTN
jgi:gas vesicle protein